LRKKKSELILVTTGKTDGKRSQRMPVNKMAPTELLQTINEGHDPQQRL